MPKIRRWRFNASMRGEARLTGDVELRVISRAERALTLQVKDHGYKSGDHTDGHRAGRQRSARDCPWAEPSLVRLQRDHRRRGSISAAFCGACGDGKSGFSDPVIGRVEV